MKHRIFFSFIVDKISQLWHNIFMKLSTKSEYGLRAMLNIAMNGAESTTSITAISKEEGISVAYLEQLLNKLRREKLIESIRGPKGGYILAKDSGTITVADIVTALEDGFYTAHCIAPGKGRVSACKKSKGCVPKTVWMKLAKAVDDCLESITLSDLCAEAKKINHV